MRVVGIERAAAAGAEWKESKTTVSTDIHTGNLIKITNDPVQISSTPTTQQAISTIYTQNPELQTFTPTATKTTTYGPIT
jgi:hypothetical protein